MREIANVATQKPTEEFDVEGTRWFHMANWRAFHGKRAITQQTTNIPRKGNIDQRRPSR